jgi:hypothetical protein
MAAPWWVENQRTWVESARRLGLYDHIVILARYRVAKDVARVLATVPSFGPALTQFSRHELVQMVRACRDDAGIEPLGPPMLLG